MENKEYIKLTNELFKKIEYKLDEFEEDVDYDKSGDKLEIAFEAGGPKIVLNTQKALHEVWLAGSGRGWHFKYIEDQKIWFASAEQDEFYQCFSKLLAERLNREVSFS